MRKWTEEDDRLVQELARASIAEQKALIEKYPHLRSMTLIGVVERIVKMVENPDGNESGEVN